MRRRISPNSTVRRCLFPSTDDEEGRNDNSINGIKEMLELEREANMKKWHYDLNNDVPLIGKGNVRWIRQNEKGDWIGEIQNDDERDEMENKTVEPRDEEAKAVDVKMHNEVTPNPTPVKVAPPLVRKRSRADNNIPTDSKAKRKI